MPDVTHSGRTVYCKVKSGSSSYSFWSNNRKFTYTTTKQVTVPDTTGSYYIYFDDNGDLKYVLVDNLSSVGFYKYAIVAFIYWNKTKQDALFNSDELHGKDMAGAIHESIHNTDGARYASGLAIAGLVKNNTTYTGSDSGSFYDEDILHELSANTTGHRFLYRSGVDGEWMWTAPSLECAYKETGDTYYSWNEWTGTTWQLTEGTWTTDYWIIFYVATPLGILKIIGQNAYSSRSKARAAIEDEIDDLKTNGLPSAEFIFLGATIVNRNGKLQTMADGSVFYNLKRSKGGGNGSPKTSYLDDTVYYDINNITSDTTLSSQGLYIIDGATTVTLPSSDSIHNFMCKLKNINASSVTIAAQSGETIDGSASISLAQYDFATIVDGGSGNFYKI